MTNIKAVSNEFCQVFASIKFEFSLFHCASPTVNDIATSKVAAIFAGRLKSDNKKPKFFKKNSITITITITITPPG